MSDKSATEQVKEAIEKLPECEKSDWINGMQLIENPYIPDHLILMSDGRNFYVTDMLTGEVTKVPKMDWSLAWPVKFEDKES